MRVKNAGERSANIMDCYPVNLMRAVLEEHPEFSVWDFSIADFLTEISHLEKKRRKVLELRFEANVTLEEAGNFVNVTKERARQLEALGIADLRRRLLSGACKVVRQEEYSKLLGQYNTLCARFDILLSKLPESGDIAPKKIMTCCDDISTLTLSVRTRNSLTRANIRTVTDVIKFDKDDSKKWCDIRGLGITCAKELEAQIYKCTGYRLHI